MGNKEKIVEVLSPLKIRGDERGVMKCGTANVNDR